MKSKHWADGPWIGFDTETTGTDPATARILQAAVITDDPDDVLREEDRVLLVNPGIPIPAEASAVHGITADKLEGAMPPADAIPYIVGTLQGRALHRNYPLVVYNASYDLPLLMAEGRRLQPWGWAVPTGFSPMILDPLVIDRALDKYRKGSRKLEAAAGHYGVKLAGAHDAAADARAAIGIMRALVKAYPDLRRNTLEQLQQVQAKWHAEWRDHLNEYWESIGKADRVSGSWPMGA